MSGKWERVLKKHYHRFQSGWQGCLCGNRSPMRVSSSSLREVRTDNWTPFPHAPGPPLLLPEQFEALVISIFPHPTLLKGSHPRAPFSLPGSLSMDVHQSPVLLVTLTDGRTGSCWVSENRGIEAEKRRCLDRGLESQRAPRYHNRPPWTPQEIVCWHWWWNPSLPPVILLRATGPQENLRW